MKRRFCILLVAAALIAILSVPSAFADLVTFTGNVDNDFVGPKVFSQIDNEGLNVGPTGCGDEPLGDASYVVPPPIHVPSGFNVEKVYWAYDCATDCLYIGLKLCGDRIAWDADDNNSIITINPASGFKPEFTDTGLEEYALIFDVDNTLIPPGPPFSEDFTVGIGDLHGGVNPALSVTKNGLPFAGVTATWFEGPRVGPDY